MYVNIQLYFLNFNRIIIVGGMALMHLLIAVVFVCFCIFLFMFLWKSIVCIVFWHNMRARFSQEPDNNNNNNINNNNNRQMNKQTKNKGK